MLRSTLQDRLIGGAPRASLCCHLLDTAGTACERPLPSVTLIQACQALGSVVEETPIKKRPHEAPSVVLVSPTVPRPELQQHSAEGTQGLNE